MANMRKTDDFLRRLKESGLEEAFNRLSDIAVDTIGCDLTDLIDDMVYEMENPAPELKPVWKMAVQRRQDIKENKYQYIGNPGATSLRDIAEFNSPQAAMAALQQEISRSSRGSRTETTVVNGIGIDLVVDEKTAHDREIMDWKLVRQYRSKWETVDQG